MPDTPKRKTIRSRDFRIVFSNGARLRVGDNDCGITFLLETDDETGALIHEDQVQVAMTTKSLKILQLSINHVVADLERVIGPITLAPEKMAELEANLRAASITKS
jgi:hypothetical protein